MRVLHVITSLELGGAQTSVGQIVAGLRARGFDAHVAFSSNGGTVPRSHLTLVRDLARQDVPVHDVPAMRRGLSSRDPIALVQLERLMQRLRPTVAHTHASKAGIIGRVAATRAGVPHVIHTVRGWGWQGYSGLQRSLFVHAERRAARFTHHFVSVSEAMVVEGLMNGIAERDRYSVIRSGIDLGRFARALDRPAIRHELGVANHVQLVGTVARLSRPKAPLDFVAVASRIASRFPHARFVVVGDGVLRRAAERAIRSAGLSSRVTLLGERKDIPEILAALDVFVLTSHWEGLPRVVVEAVAAGVPVVTTNVGGVGEVIDHGRTGFICDPGRVDRLAELAGELLADPARASRMAALARTSLPRGLDVSAVVDAHVSLYKRLTA